jgi:hypothetical protein
MGARDRTYQQLKENREVFIRLEAAGWRPNKLKRKHAVLKAGSRFQRRGSGAANSRGQNGRSANRIHGWKKHGKTAANVPR